MTSEECLARAAEADELAKIVAFEKDKVRLRETAFQWRQRAAQTEGPAATPRRAESRSWKWQKAAQSHPELRK